MKNMIVSYETSHARVMDRIHELNALLTDPALRTQEREQLEARRDMLTVESIEMMHILADLRCRI